MSPHLAALRPGNTLQISAPHRSGCSHTHLIATVLCACIHPMCCWRHRRYSIEWYLEEAEKNKARRDQEEQPLLPAAIAALSILGGTVLLLAMR